MNIKRAIGYLVLFGVVISWAPALAGPREMEADLRELKLRLSEMEQRLAAVSGSGGRPQGGRDVANYQAGLDSLRVELQSMAGQMDELARENARLKEQLKLLQDDFKVKVNAIETRLKAVETGGGRTTSSAVTPTPPASPQNSVRGTVTPPTSAPTPAGSEEPKALYDASLQLIQKDQQFAAGEKGMREFVKKHGSHPLAINAMYWVGEALYGQKKYEDAILQFQDVILQFGDHPKVASALLKQAKAFEMLGDVPSSRTTLQKLVDRFPMSPEATKAKAQLNQ